MNFHTILRQKCLLWVTDLQLMNQKLFPIGVRNVETFVYSAQITNLFHFMINMQQKMFRYANGSLLQGCRDGVCFIILKKFCWILPDCLFRRSATKRMYKNSRKVCHAHLCEWSLLSVKVYLCKLDIHIHSWYSFLSSTWNCFCAELWSHVDESVWLRD